MKNAAGGMTIKDRDSNRKGPTLSQQDALDSKLNFQ
jgi:hypothetical protein